MGRLIIDFVKGKLKTYVDGAYDFVDVRDVATGHILACEKGRSGESYILSGKQVTLSELLLMLEEISGVKAPSFRIPVWLARIIRKTCHSILYHYESEPPFYHILN